MGPVCLFTALEITAAVTGTSIFQDVLAIEPFGFGIRLITQLLPYGLVISAFAFVYVFIPNITVQPKAAFADAIVAGVLWETTGWIFASFVVSTGQFTAVYSSFAILILLMIWVYLSWLILLVGTSVAFYYQHPEYLGIQDRVFRLSNRLRERVALHAVYLVSKHFLTNYRDGFPKHWENFLMSRPSR